MQQEPPLNVPAFTKINCPNSGPRSSHSSVLYKNHLITFGGWNAKGIGDVVILDLKKGTWTQMYPTGLSSRYGHTMSLYKQNEIIVYGGRDSKVIKDLGILTIQKENPFSLKWQLIQTTANTPFRARHSAHIYEDKMYIVGGIDKGKKSVNDVWCLSLAGHTWNKVKTTGFQQERSSHGSVLLDGRIYVFGGIVTKNTERLNDMQMLTLSTMSWQTIQPKGTIPYPMYGSSMLEENGKLYLFGGYKADGNCSNDLFIYNLGTFTWKTLQTTGDIPGPRCYQTMTWYQKKIIIWAGWREKNLYSDIFTLTLNNNTNTNDEEEKQEEEKEEEKKNDNDSKTQVDLEDNDESKMKLCIVCEDQPSVMVFLDCMHVCTCRECSKKVSSSTNKCPICREDIRDIRKVFLI